MRQIRDTTIVDLHWLSGTAEVSRVEGHAFRVSDEGQILGQLEEGGSVAIGQTIVLDPEARVVIGPLQLSGGRRGRAHAFVAETAFRTGPSERDVPKLLAQLGEIERQMEAQLGEDPLRLQKGPITAYERSSCAEFARQNLDIQVARKLPQALAEQLGAVCLFFSSDSAFVAFETVSIAKLRILMEALGRPVSSHLVEEAVLQELLVRVYGMRGTPS